MEQDYPGRITARNSFVKDLPDEKYLMFVNSDKEAPKMLLNR
jgi:hypothetical protein